MNNLPYTRELLRCGQEISSIHKQGTLLSLQCVLLRVKCKLGEEDICRGEKNHSKIMDSMFFLCGRSLDFAHCYCVSVDSFAISFTNTDLSLRKFKLYSPVIHFPTFPNMTPFPCYQKIFQVSRVVCHAGNSVYLIFSSTVLFGVFLSVPAHRPLSQNDTEKYNVTVFTCYK